MGEGVKGDPRWVNKPSVLWFHSQLRCRAASREDKHLRVSWGGGGRAGTPELFCRSQVVLAVPGLNQHWQVPLDSGLSGSGCCLQGQRCCARQAWKQTELCWCFVSLTGFWSLPGSIETSLYQVWTVRLLVACCTELCCCLNNCPTFVNMDLLILSHCCIETLFCIPEH